MIALAAAAEPMSPAGWTALIGMLTGLLTAVGVLLKVLHDRRVGISSNEQAAIAGAQQRRRDMIQERDEWIAQQGKRLRRLERWREQQDAAQEAQRRVLQEHAAWDWLATQALREHGAQIDPPPPLTVAVPFPTERHDDDDDT